MAVEAGRFVWDIDAEGFGGFSGLEVSDDGSTFTALSDRGRFLSGTITRDETGAINGIQAGEIHALIPPSPGAWAPYQIDSEGLAIAQDGTIYVSFE
ncbi:MAG TPA: esterase-like activity of phytase family protein, partial [Aliiroseovarius sp.]|nr:esterase-like activity of phytase family protein [Aliiroseovarius sp.]